MLKFVKLNGQGLVEFRANAQSGWATASPNLDIGPGYEVRTGPQDRANVAFGEGSRLEVDRASQMALELFEVDTSDNVNARLGRVRLTDGTLHFDITALPGASSFQFRTDDYITIVRGSTGSITSHPATTGQSAGAFDLSMSQGSALVGCLSQESDGALKVNILQIGGFATIPAGKCRAVRSLPDPNRAAGLLDAYGAALAGTPETIQLSTKGQLPDALGRLPQVMGKSVPAPLLPTFGPGANLVDAARLISNGTLLEVVPESNQGPAGPAGPTGPAGTGLGSTIDQLSVLRELASVGQLNAEGPIRASNGITVTGDQPLLIDNVGIVVGGAAATLGGGVNVRGLASIVGEMNVQGNASVSGNANVATISSSGLGQFDSLRVLNRTELQGTLAVAQGARFSGGLGVTDGAPSTFDGPVQVTGPSTLQSLSVATDATVSNDLFVTQRSHLNGDVDMFGKLSVAGPARLSRGTVIEGAQSISVEGPLTTNSLSVLDQGVSTRLAGVDVAETTTLHGPTRAGEITADKLNVTGNIENTGTLTAGQVVVQGNATVGGTLGVAKGISSAGNLSVTNPSGATVFGVIAGSGDTFVGGKAAITSDFTVNGDHFVVNASDGATSLRGQFSVGSTAGAPQFQVSPVTGQVSVAPNAGLDVLPNAPGELNVGTTVATGINVGNKETGTLSMAHQTIRADATTINLGESKATALNIGNSTTGTVVLKENKIEADAATLNLGATNGRTINVGSSAAQTLTAEAAGISIGTKTGGTNIGIGSTAASSLKLLGGTTLTADAQAINVGTENATIIGIGGPKVTLTADGSSIKVGPSSGSTIAVGSTGAGSVTVQGGDAAGSVSADAHSVAVGTVAARAISLGNNTSGTTLTLTGGADSTWDLGAGHTLNLQTSNGPITTGTGLFTLNGALSVAGSTTLRDGLGVDAQGANIVTVDETGLTVTRPTRLGDNLNFTGTTARTISGPTNGAGFTLSSSGPLTLTGAAESTWDVGTNQRLNLQTTGNGDIRTGTGRLTAGGPVTVTGTTDLGGNVAFTGTVARSITGPTNAALSLASNGALTVTGTGALTLTGAAASTWDLGTNHTLNLQTTGNGDITTGTGRLTAGGPLTVTATTELGDNVTFTGSAARTIIGPTNQGLGLTSTGALTLTGNAASIWDLGASHTLSLQTAGNGDITTGSGRLTAGGPLTVTTTSDLGGNVTFTGTTARSIIGPSTAALTVSSSSALTLTGNAASTWDLGASHTLSLQTTGNGDITTGTGRLTAGGPLTVTQRATLSNGFDVNTGGASIGGGVTVTGTTGLTGNLTVGNATTTIFEVVTGASPAVNSTASISPTANATYDLGTSAHRWQNVYVSGSVDATTVTSRNLSVTGLIEADAATTGSGASPRRIGFFSAPVVPQATPVAGHAALTADPEECGSPPAAGCISGGNANQIRNLKNRVADLEAMLRSYGLLGN